MKPSSIHISEMLTDNYQIHSPEMLKAILKDLKVNFVDKGLLRVLSINCNFNEVIAGNFPDIIAIIFETADDQTKYELNADTYHGKAIFKKTDMRFEE